jgi:pimeloyl-ACP methyl ester carboxylesterase
MKTTSKRAGYVESFDSTPIYYEARGEGPPIIFAYGIGCLINHWRHQIRYFSEHYQTIVFDYRGHHYSGIPEDRTHLTIDSLAQDIHALCQHLDIESASLVGHSFGSQVLIRTFDMFPHLVNNLILVNGFATNPIQGMFGVDSVSSFFHLFKQGYSLAPETIGYIWKKTINNPLSVHLSAFSGGFNIHLTSLKDIEVYAKGVASMDLDVFIRLFENMISYDGTPVLERVNVPTLIVSGSKDTLTPRSFQDVLNQKIRDSQLLEVPYGSHCTQLDMPDFVNLRIERFLLVNGFGSVPKK